MTAEEKLVMTAHNMEAYGCRFASSIATAFFRADSENRKRLVAAFPELFEKYATW